MLAQDNDDRNLCPKYVNNHDGAEAVQSTPSHPLFLLPRQFYRQPQYAVPINTVLMHDSVHLNGITRSLIIHVCLLQQNVQASDVVERILLALHFHLFLFFVGLRGVVFSSIPWYVLLVRV